MSLLTTSRRALADQRGFTIIETMVAAMILMVGVLGTVTLVDGANEQTVANQGREAATNLAREVVEQAAQLPYAQLTATRVVPSLQAVPGLASTGAGWSIKRRRFEYTVSVSACTIDDRTDGHAAAHDGRFCADSPQTDANTATQDRNGDDLRRVTVTVEWTHRARKRTVRQATLIPNPGNAIGPSIVSLSHPTWVPAGEPDPAQIVFVARPSEGATRVTFAIDGAPAVDGVDQGDGTWAWTWSGLRSPDGSPAGGKADGTYLVSAQAYDADERSRGRNVIAVQLNRRTVTPPVTFRGGHNLRLAKVVDLEWTPSPEPEVVGYRVYRNTVQDRSGAVVACETHLDDPPGQRYGCFDDDVPAGSPLYYGVVALEPNLADAAAPTESAVRWLTVSTGNTAPPPPDRLELEVDATTGAAKLTWRVPAADSDGDAIRYFRIYRGSGAGTFTRLVDRFDRTGGPTELVWMDADYDTPPYSYWVTTVDNRFGESAPLGPVTG